jgi:hypothetical protein
MLVLGPGSTWCVLVIYAQALLAGSQFSRFGGSRMINSERYERQAMQRLNRRIVDSPDHLHPTTFDSRASGKHRSGMHHKTHVV